MFGHMFKAIPIAFRMILKDPVNFILAIIPTIIALALYVSTIIYCYRQSDRLAALFRGYIYIGEENDFLAKILTAVAILFVFLIMSWTFVVVVGIIAAPFNSMMSSRIEKRLVLQVEGPNREETFEKINNTLWQTFKNEFKKLFFILIVSVLAFVFHWIPFLYPVGVILIALMLAVQFVDYSWSRSNMTFGACVKDVFKNIVPYSLSGLFFLMMITVPLVNAFISAYATSYYTVLWLYRQNKIAE